MKSRLFALALVLFVLSPTAAIALPILGLQGVFEWPIASGPVTSYEVFVSRDGAASALEQTTTTFRALLTGTDKQTVIVKVRGCAEDGVAPAPAHRCGPFSVESLPYTFAAIAPPPAAITAPGAPILKFDANLCAPPLKISLASDGTISCK